MATDTNRCYRLRRRPVGSITQQDLELCEESIPTIEDGQALVRVIYLSIDPTNRIWMSDMRGYMPPVSIDAVMRGSGVGEVIESKRDGMKAGDLVAGPTGWQEYCVVGEGLNDWSFSVLPSPLPAPVSYFLGVLGHTGITAYLGLDLLGWPRQGETVVVSGAAGAVGSIAGQLAKLRGGRVVGIAGGPEKCKHVVETLGFDACVDYKAGDWQAQLDAACPDGIDFDFENVGGEIMDRVFARLNFGARICLCGMISQYDLSDKGNRWTGQTGIGQMIMARATMKSFVVLDHADRFAEAVEHLAGPLQQGKLHHDEHIVEGIEQALTAINSMFQGGNTGKLLIQVSSPPRTS